MSNQIRGLRVKVFNTVPTQLEDEINQWLSENPEAVLRDIRVLQVENNGLSPTLCCLIFHGGKEDPSERKAGFRGGV
jgi:hypothetical protein